MLDAHLMMQIIYKPLLAGNSPASGRLQGCGRAPHSWGQGALGLPQGPEWGPDLGAEVQLILQMSQ